MASKVLDKEAGLNAEQERFCEEFIIDLNATKAYCRAYNLDKEKSAAASASRLLTNVKVQARIAELKEARSGRVAVDADFVLGGLIEVAKRSMEATPVMEWDYENKCMVQKQDDEGKGVWEFDSTGANRSLELLGKHLGLFEKDNKQKTDKIRVKIT